MQFRVLCKQISHLLPLAIGLLVSANVVQANMEYQPNVLFILDTSGSMKSNIQGTPPPYDPTDDYGDSDDNYVYVYGGHSGDEIGDAKYINYEIANGQVTIAKTSLVANCPSAALNIDDVVNDSTPYYFDKAVYEAGSDVVELDIGLDMDPAETIWCQADDVGNKPADGTSCSSWSSTSCNDDIVLVSANYHDWLQSVGKKRDLMVQTVKQMIDSYQNMNMAVMRFMWTGQGGFVLKHVTDTSTLAGRIGLKEAVDLAQHSGGTPLSEVLWEAFLYLDGGVVDYGLAMTERDMAAETGANYNSPIISSSAKNHIVYLTDGKPTGDNDAIAKIESEIGATCSGEAFGTSGNCLDDLAGYMYNRDFKTGAGWEGVQNVTTHTIAFDLNGYADVIDYLNKTAVAGGDANGVYQANSAAELTAAFTNILNGVFDHDGDGLLNDVDTDDDNDGMPDDWEITYGLDPLDATGVNGASGDLDGDGANNLFEYQNNTNPLIFDPNKPVYINKVDTSSMILSSGGSYNCVHNNGDVICWGDNSDDQDLVPALNGVVSITSSSSHTCILDNDGVSCWGSNNNGKATVPALSNPTQVSAGSSHTCAIDDNGASCWGSDYFGQLTIPVLNNPMQISAGYRHTCAIDTNGAVCWGDNSYSQTLVPVLNNPTQISAGTFHTCALDDNGVKCWGVNYAGETIPPTLSNPVYVTTGGVHTCALDDSGVKCWGSNSSGQATVPVLINPVQVATGSNHTCAVDDSGVVCWGDNTKLQASVPVAINPVDVSCGDGHTCLLDDKGVLCWGNNINGQAAPPTLINPSLVDVAGDVSCAIDEDSSAICWGDEGALANAFTFENPRQLSTSGGHTCVLDDNGVQCWGANFRGQTIVPALSNPIFVNVGGNVSCAIDDNGLQCWGSNVQGHILVPILTNPSTVTIDGTYACAIDDNGVQCWGTGASLLPETPALSNPTKLSAYNYNVCALDDSGAVCWGENSHGQTTIPILNNPVAVEVGLYHACAIDDNGVQCWGAGELGDSSWLDYGQSIEPALHYIFIQLLDSDADGIEDGLDWDDDNDGIPDTVDADPLSNTVTTENNLPLDGTYKGKAMDRATLSQ